MSICGLIELIFGEHVHNSLIFIMNGGDWIWSSEQLYFSPRTVAMFGEISPLSLCKVVEIAKINLS